MTTILQATDLKKTYMLGKVPVEALSGVNLKVESGEFLAILGPSGSGKSTLLNLIGALDKPTSGTLLIQSTDISTLNDNELTEIRSRIGFVFQFFNLIPRFTAKNNVELSMSIAGVSGAERQKRVAQLLDMVGLRDRMNHKPAELSGGQQQRVAIARALANNPRFLLLDEPTGNIDSKTAKEIMELIKKLNADGVTIIMVTHDQTIAKLAKRTVQVFDGKKSSDEVNQMKPLDVLSYSFSAIKLRKLRAALTTLGVVIGIAAIVALLSITQGLQTAITGQLESGFAADTVIVMPNTAGGSTSFKLYLNYTSEIASLSPDIISAFPAIQQLGFIEKGNVTHLAPGIVGLNFSEYQSIYSKTFVAASGNMPQPPAEDEIVVGARISDPMQNGTAFVAAGDEVTLTWINATTYPFKNESYTARVAAVLPTVGSFGIGGPNDLGVYIPISKAQSFFGTDEAYAVIVRLNSSSNTTITEVSKAIREHFENQVIVISSTAVTESVSAVFSANSLFLSGIAAISLLVAGIGIMNIMIVSLIERTREIGILKALGMKSRTVLMIFLGESVIIGLIGAVAGIVIGWGMANVILAVLGQTQSTVGLTITPILSPTVLAGALAFGVGVSVIFALYPAWRASKLKPVEALRYE